MKLIRKTSNFIKKTGKYLTMIDGRKIFIFLGVTLIFFISLRSPTDPDMGWHLQDGKYLLENNLQVAHKDIFSYTMPDYPLIMHEWLTDTWMFFIYQKFNLFVLSIIFASITALAFILVSWGIKAEKEYKIIAAILGLIASIPILGVRPQMISLLGLAIVIFLIFKFRENPKTEKIFFLPLIFFIWVNFHGGFAVGLFFLALFISIEIAKLAVLNLIKLKKKTVRLLPLKDLLEKSSLPARSLLRISWISFFSFLATMLNPYGWKMYIEVFNTISDKFVKSNIGEWQPVTIYNPMSSQLFIYLILFGILLLMSYRRIDYTYLATSSVFLYLAFSSWRHIPIFLIVSTPLWVTIVEDLSKRELARIVQKKLFILFSIVIVFFVAKQQIQRVSPLCSSVSKLAEEGEYPFGAVEYLKNNPIEGNMYNEYNWGGYLIWQYPEKKVFIDGRMPIWKMGDQKIFEECYKIANFENGWEGILEKYDVNFSLVRLNPFNRLGFLNLGWKEVYCDNLACIYVRGENKEKDAEG
jgi:hypothetical protein